MDATAKQTIVERIKGATNILVTVSRDPSVDELSAALALTLMLNKMDKHATAVVSGKVPSALEFLEPNKTFENTVDSLRDFIIALDKEKADRLRYKVEDDVVRIFITPYRTTISEKDLNFSQGDFNVELVIALGVEKKDDLDTAIAAHGRILHDATVVSINADGAKSSLGSVDWSDASVSSLCEMLMSLSEALQSGLLDEQIASALLTGLVAATERFSNTHTSPRVMTMAAQLMAAGANQQLIAAKLQEGHELPEVSQVASAADGTTALKPEASAKLKEEPEKEVKTSDGEMQIEHEPEAPQINEKKADTAEEVAAETELAQKIAAPVAPTLSVDDLKKDLDEAAKDLQSAAAETDAKVSDTKGDWRTREIEPTFGGTLSATADEAEEEKRREELSDQNHKILTHDAPSAIGQGFDSPSMAAEPPSVDPFAEPPRADPSAPMHYEPIAPKKTIMPIAVPDAPVHKTPTLADLEAEAHAHATEPASSGTPLDDARAAVDAALGALPSFEEPSMPASNTPAPLAPPALPSADEPVSQVTPPLPPLPPLPDFSTLPPLPSDPAPQAPPAEPEIVQPPHVGLPDDTPLPSAPQSTDPGQFKIPGQ